jgi:hypothetical protein
MKTELYIKFWLPLFVIAVATALIFFDKIEAIHWTLLASAALGTPLGLQGWQGLESRKLQVAAMEHDFAPPVPLMAPDNN